LHRARAYAALNQFESAIQDFQTAQEWGENDSSLNASLVRAYFQTGDFQSAIAAGQEALINSPDDLWLRQQVSLSILASGETRAAINAYQQLLDSATQEVSKQRQLGDNPAEIWWLLDEATFQLEQLSKLLQSAAASKVTANIKDRETVSQTAQQLADRLRAQSIALQYNIAETNSNSTVQSQAAIGKPSFVSSKTPDKKYVYKVEMQFSYSALEPGQMLIFKVYRNGIQDPSWSFNQRWTGQKQQGLANFTLSPSYSGLYIVPPGLYTVDIYLNNQLLQQSEFSVSNPDVPAQGTTGASEPAAESSQDMYDPFDY
jgi:tetratricopeptide (TPR) repeat protein